MYNLSHDHLNDLTLGALLNNCAIRFNLSWNQIMYHAWTCATLTLIRTEGLVIYLMIVSCILICLSIGFCIMPELLVWVWERVLNQGNAIDFNISYRYIYSCP